MLCTRFTPFINTITSLLPSYGDGVCFLIVKTVSCFHLLNEFPRKCFLITKTRFPHPPQYTFRGSSQAYGIQLFSLVFFLWFDVHTHTECKALLKQIFPVRCVYAWWWFSLFFCCCLFGSFSLSIISFVLVLLSIHKEHGKLDVWCYAFV